MSQSRNLEIEWQFDLPGTGFASFTDKLRRAGPQLGLTDERCTTIRDEYFDTDDALILSAGFTLRRRRDSQTVELTLKATGSAKKGQRQRLEVNEPIADEAIAPLAAPGVVGEALRGLLGTQELKTIARIDTERRVFRAIDAEGLYATVAADETKVDPGGDTERTMSRVEIEAENGRVDDAGHLALLLRRAHGLKPAQRSKLEFALNGSRPEVESSQPNLGPTELWRGMGARQLAEAVLRTYWASFLAAEPGTRLGVEPEALHQARVAARRLRSAISTFEAWLPADICACAEDIKVASEMLGTLRDLDVLLEQIDNWRPMLPGESGPLDRLETDWVRKRNDNRSTLLAFLDSAPFVSFKQQFETALRDANSDSGESIESVAPKLIESRFEKILSLASGLTADSRPELFHAVRIEVKKTRYAVEAVAPAYGKRAKRFARSLEDVQSFLGTHQDACVAMELLREASVNPTTCPDPLSAFALGVVAGQKEAKAQQLRMTFQPLLERVQAQEWPRFRRRVLNRAKGS